MSKENRNPEDILNEAVEALRSEGLSGKEVDEAAARTREALGFSGEPVSIRSCEDFRALIPGYLDGSLSPARELLLEDHSRECVACRKELTSARTKAVVRQAPVRTYQRPGWMRWAAVAAGLVMAALLFQMMVYNGMIPGIGGQVAAVAEFRGEVFGVTERGLTSVDPGQAIEAHQFIRTGKGSGAVLRLEDGSEVEMAERTEVGISQGWWSTTVQLRRGHVIVEAAEQGSGRLYVATDDCRVAVKGTVFSVSSGMKGSRVAVIEGEVWVEQGRHNEVLEPGQQYASRPGLKSASLAGEFNWSRKADSHLAMLQELSELHRKIQEATLSENLRFSSELAGHLPADTVVFAALPNVSEQLETVFQEFKPRLEQNPAFAQWKAEDPEALQKLEQMETLMAKFRSFGAVLGEEIVVAAVSPSGFKNLTPVLLAEVTDASTLISMLQNDLEDLAAQSGGELPIQLVTDPSAASSEGRGLLVYVGGGLIVTTPSAELLESVVNGTDPGSFADSGLYEAVSGSYAGGVDWLLAVDFSRVVAETVGTEADSDHHPRALEPLGISQMNDLLVERKQVDGITENRAVLSYEGAPRGLLSWTAEPGPMGGLEFVSADASFAAAFVVRSPALLLDEVFEAMQSSDQEAWAELVQFETEHGISIREDIAAPLGGELVVALDGPILPTPSWKVVVEVYQPEVLQRTVEWAVGEINGRAAEEGVPGLSLTVSALNGAPLYELVMGESGPTVYYQFINGYLIAAPSPALISKAAQYRAASYSLANSADFVGLLPKDDQLNLSGFFYQNMGQVLNPILESGIAGTLAGPENEAALRELLGDVRPLLVGLYSEPGQLTVASNGDLDSLWRNFSTLGALGGPQGILKLMEGAAVQ